MDVDDEINYRNKTQKRVTALNRDLPPRNEQFLLDFEQLQNQFPVSFHKTDHQTFMIPPFLVASSELLLSGS